MVLVLVRLYFVTLLIVRILNSMILLDFFSYYIYINFIDFCSYCVFFSIPLWFFITVSRLSKLVDNILEVLNRFIHHGKFKYYIFYPNCG